MEKKSVRHDAGVRMMDFIRAVYPLQRMINSEGMDEAFRIVKEMFPESVIHEYEPGLTCGDWIVPRAWKVRTAWMKDKSGNEIANFDNAPLFVAAYSEPVKGWFSKEEVAKHLRCHPTRPYAYLLEHRNAYNYKVVDWGITLPASTWERLPDGEYEIFIDVEWADSTMKVAEIFLEGESEQVISISAHIDEICNDDLSGCAVGLELIRHIRAFDRRKYSYQLLLVPETVGTFFYVFNNMPRVSKTIGMYNLETTGAGEEWILKKAFSRNSYIETALRCALDNRGTEYRELGFFEGYGNDERVYEWPTIGIPGVALQRFPFNEYHSSDDTPDNINPAYLEEALRVSIEFVSIIENDYVPQFTSIIPPWLSRHDLYYDSKDDPAKFHQFNNLVLFNVNGINKITDIATITGLRFTEVYDYLEKFVKKGFASRQDIGSINKEVIYRDENSYYLS